MTVTCHDQEITQDRQVSRGLHRWVYYAMVGLAACYALSAWIGFAGGYDEYLLSVVTGFIVMSVALPAIAGRVWRHHRLSRPGKTKTFPDWIAGEFDTSDQPVKASTATIEILLPLAAVAFGMTLFAILALVES
ncbi:hypothetical protein EN828_30970 [Mesorhizobium sp. M2D.F.Ca.ET.185.01.1.1]|uniref:hypothetical protein n=1 Tax=unclassified Mesorhizobium TaxID=325217 RepID=UPI000FCA4563|nr:MULTISPECIES: hypothetical protein [unclassified Mesorhizobium]TGP73242.1 hypothetical protein EN870_30620 [bacterium M00.F.Ca.ET.227.01.1.1]TGP84227.1 hypothetical protein EN864_31320 [bacterium M00.F.Ca.ET.221.01.1.1]TGP86873.1 hypothetical protein EN865_30725 [bacterium M00.F.Ca.ET.222.01.1.1]TGT66000.1 hypothetical protein EN802_30810 [bacterium M00.F.Ca.ET.159.01.1.1]TGT79685.1 hypothetical protein EN800_30150 [bacterium M00.F.Ca.ET.157.01.1.1]TGU19099.1 hypothetical protein EN799_592